MIKHLFKYKRIIAALMAFVFIVYLLPVNNIYADTPLTAITVELVDARGDTVTDSATEGDPKVQFFFVSEADGREQETPIDKIKITDPSGENEEYTIDISDRDSLENVKIRAKYVIKSDNDNPENSIIASSEDIALSNGTSDYTLTLELKNGLDWDFNFSDDGNYSVENGNKKITTSYYDPGMTDGQLNKLNYVFRPNVDCGYLSNYKLEYSFGNTEYKNIVNGTQYDCVLVDCELVDVSGENSIEGDNTNLCKQLNYSGVGKKEIKLQLVDLVEEPADSGNYVEGPCARFLKEKSFCFEVRNSNMGFFTFCNTAQSGEVYDVEEGSGRITTVTKTYSSYDAVETPYTLKLEMMDDVYKDDIEYSISADYIPQGKVLGDYFEIASDGKVTVKGVNYNDNYVSCKVTAICRRTSNTAEYILKVYPAICTLSLQEVNSDGTTIRVDSGHQYNFVIGNDIGKTFKVIGSVESGYEDKYDISYSVDKDTVSVVNTAGNVDNTNGTVTIHKANEGDECATVTITATPKDGYIWLNTLSDTYQIKIATSKGNTKVFTKDENNADVEWDTAHTIEIREDSSAFIYDEDGNGTGFVLPFEVKGYDTNGREISCRATVSVVGYDAVTFDGTDNYKITNPNIINRNKDITYRIHLVPNDPTDARNFYFDDRFVKVKIIGVKQTSRFYDIEEGDIVEGADGNRWAVNDKVTLNVKSALEASIKFQDGRTSYDIMCNESTRGSDVEHIIILYQGSTEICQREYFGVDTSAPTIEQFGFSNNATIASRGVYAKDSVDISVVVADIEKCGNVEAEFGHLYKVELLNGSTVIAVKTVDEFQSDKRQSLTFTIDKDTYANQALDLRIKVTDRAGRVTIKSLADIKDDDVLENNLFIIDTLKPVITKSIIKSSETVNKDISGKDVYSDDVSVKFDLTDLDSFNVGSGIKKCSVVINGRYSDAYSKEYSVPVGSDSITVDTSGNVTSDGSVTIEVIAYDYLDNPSDVKTVTVYIDKVSPDVNVDKIITEGNTNFYTIGNYFNNNIQLVLNCRDNLSAISKAELHIDNTTYYGVIDNSKVSFNLPVGIKGNATVYIWDEFNNCRTMNLSEIKNMNNSKAFESDYIHIDNRIDDFKINTETNPDGNQKWYNKEVIFKVHIEDDKINPSGLREIKSYINDVEITDNRVTLNTRTCHSYDLQVKLDNNMIDSLIREDGSYTLYVVATDNAGNVKSDTKKVYVDKVAPVINSVTGVNNGSFNTGVVNIYASVSEKHFNENGNKTYAEVTRVLDNEITIFTLDAEKAVSNRNTSRFVFSEDGTYKVTICSVDAAGNKTVAPEITFSIDNTLPLCSVTGISDNAFYLDSASMALTITESNYENCKINVNAIRELNGQTFEVPIDIFIASRKVDTYTKLFNEEGEYTVTVNAVDAAGNVSATQTIRFTIDISKPMVTISNVKENTAYANGVTPVITFIDNYYDSYRLKLVKTGVYFGSDVTFTSNLKNTDVTNLVTKTIDLNSKGGTITIEQFPDEQEYDGVYTLTIWVTDKAGRETESSVTFSINRYGSVYSLDNSLYELNNKVISEIDNNFKIREYNATEVLLDSIKVDITRDGTPIIGANVNIDRVAVNSDSESGWYEYIYTIDKSNFDLDGIYVIEVTSTDAAGNRSQSLSYDGLKIEFAIDRTKPDIVSVSGLEDINYKAEKITFDYEVFDAIGLKQVKVYVNNNVVQVVDKFEDVTSYKGTASIDEGTSQRVRIEVTDLAGNVIDSDKEEDIASGKIADFNREVTISTNFFVIWYSNKLFFYLSIGGVIAFIGAVTILIVLKKRKR